MFEHLQKKYSHKSSTKPKAAIQRKTGSANDMMDERLKSYSPISSEPVQHDRSDLEEMPDARGATPADTHSLANTGISTHSKPMPFAAKLEPVFGKELVQSVDYHDNPTAAASASSMGAKAYATGTHVVSNGSMSLRTAAHEVAHIAQQRKGVQLKGGVGEVGDKYEREADEIADAVVAGKSAEGLLSQSSSGSLGDTTHAMQLKPAGGLFRCTT